MPNCDDSDQLLVYKFQSEVIYATNYASAKVLITHKLYSLSAIFRFFLIYLSVYTEYLTILDDKTRCWLNNTTASI